MWKEILIEYDIWNIATHGSRYKKAYKTVSHKSDNIMWLLSYILAWNEESVWSWRNKFVTLNSIDEQYYEFFVTNMNTFDVGTDLVTA